MSLLLHIKKSEDDHLTLSDVVDLPAESSLAYIPAIDSTRKANGFYY
jgi:hypothetical protein